MPEGARGERGGRRIWAVRKRNINRRRRGKGEGREERERDG
jgi:hypothetical protein